MAGKGRKGQRRPLWSPASVKRLLLIAPFVLVAAWLSIAVSGASIMRQARPDLAMKFQPLDARARARAAELTMLRGGARGAELQEAERLAREALQRDITLVSAWRTLGMVAAAREQTRRTTELFHFAASVSRRDLPTQLWLIEERVQQNDVAGALAHYDTALRTTSSSRDLLFPILMSAIADPTMVQPFATLMNSRPPWRHAFIERLASAPPPAENMIRFLALTRRTAAPEERDLVSASMRTFIDRGEAPAAWRLYTMLGGGRDAADALVRNGSFDRPNAFPPFDWQLQQETDLIAEQRPPTAAGGNARLQITAENGVGGMAARQLLLLRPGTYQLTAQAGRSENARPAKLYWRVSCAGADGAVLNETDLPALTDQAVSAARFVVPQGCTAQQLDLGVRPDLELNSVAAWLDSVAIRPVSG
jgi:hypothetical protein